MNADRVALEAELALLVKKYSAQGGVLCLFDDLPDGNAAMLVATHGRVPPVPALIEAFKRGTVDKARRTVSAAIGRVLKKH